MANYLRFSVVLLLLGISQPSLAAWEVEQSRDPITDSIEVDAALEGQGGHLHLLCSGKTQKVRFVFQPDSYLGGPIGKYEFGDVWFRFDNDPALTGRWKYEHTYVEAPSDQEIADIAVRMAKAQKVAVRVRRFDDALIDATFVVTGAGDALSSAAKICQGQKPN